MLSSEQVAEIKARAEAATPGPWHPFALGRAVRHLERNCEWYFEDYDGNPIPDNFRLPGRQSGDGGQRDGDFIAHARTDIPALLADRDELVRRLGTLEAAIRELPICPLCGGRRGDHRDYCSLAPAAPLASAGGAAPVEDA